MTPHLSLCQLTQKRKEWQWPRTWACASWRSRVTLSSPSWSALVRAKPNSIISFLYLPRKEPKFNVQSLFLRKKNNANVLAPFAYTKEWTTVLIEKNIWNLNSLHKSSVKICWTIFCKVKGAQAWEFFARVFCSKRTHLGMWLRLWGKKSNFLSNDPWLRRFMVLCCILSVR